MSFVNDGFVVVEVVFEDGRERIRVSMEGRLRFRCNDDDDDDGDDDGDGDGDGDGCCDLYCSMARTSAGLFSIGMMRIGLVYKYRYTDSKRE